MGPETLWLLALRGYGGCGSMMLVSVIEEFGAVHSCPACNPLFWPVIAVKEIPARYNSISKATPRAGKLTSQKFSGADPVGEWPCRRANHW